MPTLEEASRCPKCTNPGKLDSKHLAAELGKGTVYVYECEEERCKGFGKRWLVQVRPDGTIPERKPGPKQFTPLTAGQEASARAYLEQVQLENRRQQRGR